MPSSTATTEVMPNDRSTRENIWTDNSTPSPEADTNDFLQFDTYNYVITFALLVLCAYIFVALVIYYARHRPRHRTLIHLLCFLNAGSAFAFSIKGVLWLLWPAPTYDDCLAVAILGYATLMTATLSTYTLLWVRQRKLYTDKQLKTKPLLTALNALLLAVIYAFYFASLCVFVSGEIIVPKRIGCDSNYTKIDNTTMGVWFSLAVAFIHVALFLSIAFPLLGRNRMRAAAGAHESARTDRMARDVRAMLVRLSLCSLSCCVSTILCNVCTVFAVHSNLITVHYWGNFICIDLFINSVSSVFTFSTWKRKLWPFYRVRDADWNSGTGQAVSSRLSTSIALLRRSRQASAS